MRQHRILAITGAAALTLATIATLPTASATPTSQAAGATAATKSSSGSYVVLAKDGVSAESLAKTLTGAGATVTAVNTAVGMVTVTATGDFAGKARTLAGVDGAASDRSIGSLPQEPAAPKVDAAENEAANSADHHGKRDDDHGKSKGSAKTDPLDNLLWGMQMIKAPQAHQKQLGDRRVLVGVMDTGIQADHPDLAPNFSTKLSRNFTTDIEAIDGPCEYAGCVDPATVDDDGHGTHVAGTMAAALNGVGVSGVAPNVTLVSLRAGQDSGYFFLGPTVNALTYAGDAGVDVVNMSFYVDPWAFNCRNGAPEDSPGAVIDQQVIIKAMTRALNYANRKGVTLVGALGNAHTNLSKPPVDESSPDYDNPLYDWDNAPYSRTIDNKSCFDLPVEGPNVIGVSAMGPSGMKSDYSNYATDLRSGELEVAAPGGWYRDGFGTPTYRTYGNLVLSAAPTHVLQTQGLVDTYGNLTPAGTESGVIKNCTGNGAKQTCGFYQYLQGTSMASPHAAGVAALIVSSHGERQGRHGFGLAPSKVRSILMSSASKIACPAPVISYTKEGRGPEYDAACVGNDRFNSIYGAGIVNASQAIRH